MSHTTRPTDPLWPRAAHWLAGGQQGDLAFLGVPASTTSITPTGAHATPGAVREALFNYSTYSTAHELDIADLRAMDLGDVKEPDGAEGEARVRAAAASAAKHSRLLVAIGGDNSITFPLVSGLLGMDGGDVTPDVSNAGLITVDAHHDLRDGISNGSPVRRLLEAGLPGENIVQLGIADFSNSPAYALRAKESGITVVSRAALRGRDMAEVARAALEIAGRGGRRVFVDLDVDVCDRAAVPGCPSAAPGGISADELRQLAFWFAADARVAGMDVTEIDATIDTGDKRTVRLAALLVLEAAAGLHARR